MARDKRGDGASFRISDLVERTGLSKELIHHYLRLGLLPKPAERGQYTTEHARLLQLVKRLREDFHLPLEVIRQLFDVFEFDAVRMDPLVQLESHAQRMTRLAESTDLGLSRLVSADDLVARAGVDLATLEQYIEAGIVTPLTGEKTDRFTEFDIYAVALCERGVRLGVPFDSFRTVASYVRVAFDIAHSEFMTLDWVASAKPERMLAEMFVRREIVASFVHNVLHSLLMGSLRQSLEFRSGEGRAIDDVVYRPSDDFLARHGVVALIDQFKGELGGDSDDQASWRRTAELLMHAGSYREAVFFFEQALERWPADTLRGRLGIALVLGGDQERGVDLLQQVHDGDDPSPESTIYLALARFFEAGEDPESLAATEAAEILRLAEDALGKGAQGVTGVHVRCFGGWLLTALPPTFRRLDRGRQILIDLYEELRGGIVTQSLFPGLRERYLVNAAWLLFESLSRDGAPRPAAAPTAEGLRTLICRLDPSSAFARRVFLMER